MSHVTGVVSTGLWCAVARDTVAKTRSHEVPVAGRALSHTGVWSRNPSEGSQAAYEGGMFEETRRVSVRLWAEGPLRGTGAPRAERVHAALHVVR